MKEFRIGDQVVIYIQNNHKSFMDNLQVGRVEDIYKNQLIIRYAKGKRLISRLFEIEHLDEFIKRFEEARDG